MIRLLVVTAATLVQVGLSASLADERDVELVGLASSGAEARNLCAKREADVVLVESDLPDESPLALAAALRQAAPDRGVVLVGSDDDDRLLSALESGVTAYLPSSSPIDMLLAAIRRAAAAPGSFTAPNLARALRRRAADQHLLSPREGEVLAYLRDGWSVSAIARTLLVSESTVKTYVSRLYDKLGVRDRARALEMADRAGLLS